MSLKTLAARIEYLGGSKLDRLNKQKLNSLHAALKNDYNSRLLQLPNGMTMRGLINNNNLKPDYDKKILSIDFDSQLKEGDVFTVFDDNTHWMVYLPFLTETAYLRSEIIRCRYTLNIDDEEYWVYFQGPTETDLRWYISQGINYNELNLSGTIYIKDTPKTRDFFTRFQHIKLEGHQWEIQVTDYISVPGIIELEIQEYYDNTPEELPEVVKECCKSQILGKQVVEQNHDYGYEIASQYYNPDYHWSIENNPRVRVKKEMADGRICTVRVEDGAIRTFTVNYGDDNNGFSMDVDINIVESLIKGPQSVYPYDKHLYSVENDEGVFFVDTQLAIVTQTEDNKANVEILTGKKGKFVLFFKSNITNKTIELPIEIKSF